MSPKLLRLTAASLLATVTAGVGAAPPTDAQRAAAAKRTVVYNPLCAKVLLNSFYWEIGNRDGVLVSGSIGRITADTMMNIGSASKWLYSSYVVEKHGDVPANVPYLTFSSGYSNFVSPQCVDTGTVAECLPGPVNADEAADAVFHYNGGHMQQNAILLGLGPKKNYGVATEVGAMLGSEIILKYTQPQLAGGAKTSARNYALFLRKLLVGSPTPLRMGSLLGSHAVCTIPSEACNASPDVAVPEAWHYSLGHWVEDDPAGTPSMNFAYSSPGLFGFYPWVDVERGLYGIIARQGANLAQNEGFTSAQCGRVVRLAWKTGVQQ